MNLSDVEGFVHFFSVLVLEAHNMVFCLFRCLIAFTEQSMIS